MTREIKDRTWDKLDDLEEPYEIGKATEQRKYQAEVKGIREVNTVQDPTQPEVAVKKLAIEERRGVINKPDKEGP